jgi:superfamily I DNA/RNA helicase
MEAGTGPSVGVIVMGGKERAMELQKIIEGLDDDSEVRQYVDSESFDLSPFKFDEPETVTIVTQWTQKGLEWDHVFVYVDGLKVDTSPERNVIQMMQCYVAASRPRSRLVLAWSKAHNRNDFDGTPEVMRRFLKLPLAGKVEDKFDE